MSDSRRPLTTAPCRYISRPAIAEQRLSLTPNENVFEPLDFIARLAAPVPKPRVRLTRFHGVLARNSKRGVLAKSGGLKVCFETIGPTCEFACSFSALG